MPMQKFCKVAEYLGFALLVTAFVVWFAGVEAPPYVIPQTSLLGAMLVAWGIGGQE